ncbi:MAG TPA: prolyl oligopeptidase family serine peptidase [bacterium]|nr:prolyl oligopeptidase family serine peptidase [bacterium]
MANVQEIKIKSSVDGTTQPNIIITSSSYNIENFVPLLVALHTWQGDYKQLVKPIEKQIEKRNWVALLPNFRGPNCLENPDCKKACGSEYAQRDIVDAINYVFSCYKIDKQRVYLIGGSGGGYMSLMMVAKYPNMWSAVSTWASISDLKKWWEENKNYSIHIEACLGGPPGKSSEIDKEYYERSPINFITSAKNVWLDIHHGINDMVVPYHHSEDVYKKLIDAGSKKARFTLFKGGHTINYFQACQWVSKKSNEIVVTT